jgi:multidrug efflux pump subunit AcrA (membrane-fusion protein)
MIKVKFNRRFILPGLWLILCLIAPVQVLAKPTPTYYKAEKDNGDNSSRSSNHIYYTSARHRNDKRAEIVTVTNAKTGAHVVLSGTVIPYREVTLTAQTPGRIEYLAGKEGDWFNKGQVLMSIDDDGVMAQRRQAIANYYGRSSSLQNARAQYSREFWDPQAFKEQQQPAQSAGFFPNMFQQFFGFGGGQSRTGNPYGGLNPWVVRDVDLYSQGTNVSQAQSGIMGAQSRIDEIDAHLRDTFAISPFEGVVVKKLAEVGDTVQPGQAILQYADTRYLQLKVDVPARLVSALSKDMVVPAKLDVGDTYIDVRVAQIFPTADSQEHTVTVKFDLPSGVPGGPGMYAEVMIPDVNTPIRDMPIIPLSAIIQRGSLPAVFVLNRDNRAEMRLVRLGDQVDEDHVAVLSGVYPGEQIFASPPPGIQSGWSPDSPNQ